MTQTRYRASLDYLTFDITGPSEAEVDNDAFQVCFSRSIRVPINPIWYNATNNGNGTITILEGPSSPALVTTLTAGTWFMMIKVVDNPTLPVYFGGDIVILN